MGGCKAFDGDGNLIQKLWHHVEGDPANVGNVRAIARDDGDKKLPTLSRTPNRVYLIRDDSGAVFQLGIYGKNRKMLARIDFGHEHQGMKPHVQYTDSKGVRHTRNPNAFEWALIRRLQK